MVLVPLLDSAERPAREEDAKACPPAAPALRLQAQWNNIRMEYIASVTTKSGPLSGHARQRHHRPTADVTKLQRAQCVSKLQRAASNRPRAYLSTKIAVLVRTIFVSAKAAKLPRGPRRTRPGFFQNKLSEVQNGVV